MQDGRSHPLLAQLPLTVSPFINLPTATTLPYTYESLPSTLPPSSTQPSQEPSGQQTTTSDQKPAYVLSPHTNHAAHPSDILKSVQALQSHLEKQQREAEDALKAWKEDIRQRELAEKRRLAPGWLDREEKILAPAKGAAAGSSKAVRDGGAEVQGSLMDAQEEEQDEADGRGAPAGMDSGGVGGTRGASAGAGVRNSIGGGGMKAIESLVDQRNKEGEELDRAFGGLAVK